MSNKSLCLLIKHKLLTLDNTLCLFLSIYCFINALYYTHPSSFFEDVKISVLPICFIFAVIAFLGLKWIFKKSDTFFFPKRDYLKKQEFAVYSTLILLACIISIVWNYPASMHSDAMSQYQQAVTNQYNDIHPLFHTFFFFKLPTLIWPSYTSCAFFQCLFISVILLYFCYFCRKYFLNEIWTVIILILILINPTFLKTATMPLKDVPFSYCLMLCTLFLIEIFITNGKWLTKTKNKILFCTGCFGIVFIRHNGIANFLLMIIPLIIFYRNNRLLLTSLCIVFTISKFISTPIFKSLGIKKTLSTTEIIGIPLNHPLNQMSYIYNNGGIVTEHNKEIMNNINRLENWTRYYNRHNFYNQKRTTNGYKKTFVANNYDEILKTWLQMAYRNPILAIKSEVHITSSIWCIHKSYNFMNNKYLKVEQSGPKWLTGFMDKYVLFLQHTHLKNILIDVSEGLLIILISLCLTTRKMRRIKKAYLPYTLVVSNVLIIISIITSGAPRFVYSSVLCAYPLVLYALYLKQAEHAITPTPA